MVDEFKQLCERSIAQFKKHLKQNNLRFNKKLSDPNYLARTPFCPIEYRSKLDITMLCDDSSTNYYQNLIGVLRWIVELGWIGIAFEVLSLSKLLSYPSPGHIYQALHIYKYLKTHIDNDLSFDPMYHDFANLNQNHQKIDEMKKIYVKAKEEFPTNAPKHRGKSVQLNCFMNSDHAGDCMTRRSQTGILIFGNSAPMNWYSKKQNTVESSTLRAEFVALQIATELITSFRYKLRMFGIPVTEPANVFCDNEVVYKSSAFAELQLRRKHQSICYHLLREAVAAGKIIVHKVDGKDNLANLLTNSVPAHRRKYLRSKIMFSEDKEW